MRFKDKEFLFIIVLFNPAMKRIYNLLRCIGDNSIVLIDNSETEGHVSQLITSYLRGHKNVKYLKTEMNIGYSAAINKGIEHGGATQKFSWFIILNQDIDCSARTILHLLSKLSITSPKTLVGTFCGTLDRRRWSSVLYRYHTHSNNVDYISGSLMAIPGKILRKVGLFYEPYFLYYEDADFSVRAKKSGFDLQCIRLPDIAHHTDFLNQPLENRRKEYYLARNHLLFVLRQAPIAIKIIEFFRLPVTIAEHFFRQELYAMQGIYDFLTNNFGYKKL